MDFYISNGLLINILFTLFGLILYLFSNKKFKKSKKIQNNLMYYKFDLVIIYMLIAYTLTLCVYCLLTWLSGNVEFYVFVQKIEYMLPLLALFAVITFIVLLGYFSSHLKKYGDFRNHNNELNYLSAKTEIKNQDDFLKNEKIFNTYSKIMIVVYIILCIIFPFTITLIWLLFYFKVIKYSNFKY